MKQERQKYWNEEVVGMDKLERRNYLKQIYATFNPEQFEKVKVYITGGEKVPEFNIFANRKSCWNFFWNCAKENLPGSKERIEELNKLMNLPDCVEH